jgi:DNA-binding SARP family transcriptional activator
MPQLVEFNIAGRHEIVTPLGRVLTPQSEQLFALLLCCGLSCDFRMSTRRMRELLWSESPVRNPSHALRQLVYRARQFGIRITLRDGMVQLEPSQLAPRFVLTRAPALLYEDASASHDIATGDLCAGWVPRSRALDEWLEQERRRFLTDVRLHLLSLIDQEYRLGNHAHTERFAERLCRVDPINPLAHFRYAQAVAIRGDLREASHSIARFVREHAPVKTRATEELLRLHDQLRRTVDAATPPGTTFRLLGWEPLLFQIDHCLAATVARNAQVVRVARAPASGKTTLASEVGRRATVLGFRTIVVHAQPAMSASATERPLPQRLVQRLLAAPGGLGIPSSTLENLRCFAGIAAEASPVSPPSLPSHRGARLRVRPGEQQHQGRSRLPLLSDVMALITCVTEEQPVLLCIEDWTAADPATRSFLGELSAQLDVQPVLLLCTEGVDGDGDGTPRVEAHEDGMLRGLRQHALAIPRLAPDQARGLAEHFVTAFGIDRRALPVPMFGTVVPDSVGAVVQWLQQFQHEPQGSSTARPIPYSVNPSDGSSSSPPSYSRNLR